MMALYSTQRSTRGRLVSTGLVTISLRVQVPGHLVKPLGKFITANTELALAA